MTVDAKRKSLNNEANGRIRLGQTKDSIRELRLNILEYSDEKGGAGLTITYEEDEKVPHHAVEVNKEGEEEEPEEDPFKAAFAAPPSTPWSQLSGGEKVKKVLVSVGKTIGLLTLLYFFVCSLDCLSLGFRLVGGRTTGEIFRQSDIIKNPVVGVMIGILTTVLVQSSSTSTSIIVSMVASNFLETRAAIPIIMGANIGTSITNTIVSLTQAGDRAQFRRAFAGATVHDMFNWLTVILLLILEVTTGYLYHLTTAVMGGVSQSGSGGEIEILGKITKPFVNLIVQLNSAVLTCWSEPNCTEYDNASLLKQFCSANHSSKFILPASESNLPMLAFEQEMHHIMRAGLMEEARCKYLFAGTSMSDVVVGLIVLLSALLVLCTCLILIVKILNSVLQGQMAVVIQKTLNSDIKYVPWLTGYIAIAVGAIMTFLVQSSSVFTSALTPLVGVGVISVERVYPLTLGSNIGTTTTALIAALAVTGDKFYPSLQVALCHFFFNITGILIFYPIPFMRFPIGMSKFLGKTTAKYRWFAVAYMVLMFMVLPAIVMGLSFAGTIFVIIFALLVLGIGSFVLAVNFLRKKKPEILPAPLMTWNWLPEPLRSLEPYDRIFSSFACCKKLKNLDNAPAAPAAPATKEAEAVATSEAQTGATTVSRRGYVNQSFDDAL